MTTVPGRSPIPASWYPDPADPASLRWWDGNAWTENLTPNPAAQTTPSPLVYSPPSYPPSDQSIPAYSAPVYTAPAPTLEASDSFDYASTYVPMDGVATGTVHSRSGASASTASTTAESSTTWAIWVYAVLPLIVLPALFFKFQLDTEDNYSIVRLVLVGLGIILTVVLASIDHSILVRRDYEQTPSGVLGVIPPAYVVARTVKVGASGLPALLVAILIQAAIVVYALVVFGVIGGAPSPPEQSTVSSVGMVPPFTAAQRAYLQTPEGMAAKLRYDSQATPLRFDTVTCPDFTPSIGAQVMCTATGPIAEYQLQVELLGDFDIPFVLNGIVPTF